MHRSGFNAIRIIGCLLLILHGVTGRAETASWEMILLGSYDPSAGGTVLSVTPTSTAGTFKVSMEVPNYFSWRSIDADGQHPSLDVSELNLFLNAWNMLYGTEWANAELLVSDYSTKQRSRVAIRMGPPYLDADNRTLVFKAKFQRALSPLLASLDDTDQAVLAKKMLRGRIQGMSALWIENASQTPHDQLSKGIRFQTRKVRASSAPARLSGVSTMSTAPSTTTVINTSAANLIKPSGDCTADNVTMAWVLAYVSARSDVQAVKSTNASWGRSLNDSEKLAIARAYMLPCEPRVGDADANVPDNVKRVKSILTKDKWKDLMTQATRGEPDTTMTTAERATYSYDNFLRMVGKYPFFCAEQGIYSSLDEACRRELATIFAHGAQETGAHDANLVDANNQPLPEWKQAFSKVFEGACYSSGKCKDYNPDVGPLYVGGKCPTGYKCTQDYYGRGVKQISYYYNYMGFSGQMLGDPQTLLTDPNAVGRNGLLGLGSGIWFYMTPQPPKPSMHDVITGGGGYHPSETASGVTVLTESYKDWEGVTQSAGNPEDKFMTTISVINGGIECSPETSASFDEAKKKQAKQQAINRLNYYGNLLDYFGATTTQQEQGYKTNATGCTIALGNPFASVGSPLVYNPLWYVAKNREDTSQPAICAAQSWQPDAPFAIASESSYEICKKQLP